MALEAGTRLGPYEILAALGAGGMGEVYRAHDARLARDVAIKVLPEEVAQDKDRLKRFEQEARAAGALNHPGLLTVFDVGHHEGVPYLVSELLEGAPLRSLLRGGALPLRKTLDLGAQIGRGLAAAHGRGIVHRDLKPENLFVTTDGRAKILDFGLAKLKRSLDAVATSAPTETSPSSPGTVVGTVGYMSPEQVRGETVDARSDIFSLGVVLYEMLSGRRAFRGATSIETMNAILKEDPPPLSDPDRPLPAALERIVLRCLEKDPSTRIQSAQDLAFALEALSGDARPLSASGVSVPSLRRQSGWAWQVALAAIGSLALAATFWAGRRSAERPPPVFERVTHRVGRVGEARFAPDGQTIVFSAEWETDPPRLFTARAGSLESRPLDLPGAGLLALSASGEMAVSLRPEYQPARDSMQGTLARVQLSGGAPREIQERVIGADWSPDGSELAVVHAGRKSRLDYPLGKTLTQSEGRFAHPRVSPRGDLVALFEWLDWPCAVVVVDRKGRKRSLTGYDYRLCMGLAWSPDGREVWFTGLDKGGTMNVRAVTLEGRERVVHANPGHLSLRDISPKGDVLLVRVTDTFSVYARVPGMEEERNFSWLGNSYSMDLSADGKMLLLGNYASPAGLAPMFLRPTDGTAAIRLGEGQEGRISPDGKWVLTHRKEPERIVLLPTGAGQPRELSPGPFVVEGLNWFPDSRRILGTGARATAPEKPVTWSQDLEGGAPVPLLDGYYGRLTSPDGGAIVAQASDSDPYLLCSVKDGSCRPLPGLDPEADTPKSFSADGRCLLVESESPRWTALIVRVDIQSGRREILRTLRPSDPTGVVAFEIEAVTPDGRFYAYEVGRHLSDLYLVRGFR